MDPTKTLAGGAPPLASSDRSDGRPAEENSPVSIDSNTIVDSKSFENAEEEINWITSSIEQFMREGLKPHDFLVISLDDRHAKGYFRALSEKLALKGVATNNIIADPYREPDFLIEDKVTLSTVYRAKGNEAAAVFALGVDAIDGRLRSGRNKLFTAFTRSKAWLRVSGIGASAKKFCDEIETAQEKFPNLEFFMPDPRQIETIQRDLSKKSIKAKRIRDEYKKKLRGIGMSEDEVTDYLSSEEKS